MSTDQQDLPRSPERVKAFARFFKNYMSISSLVVASLPIPVTALKLIPTYKALTTVLSVYTPLFCFLTLGFIFYVRHFLARAMFPDVLEQFTFPDEPSEPPEIATERQQKEYQKAFNRYRYEQDKIVFKKRRAFVRRRIINSLPLTFIIASLFSVYAYHWELGASVKDVRNMLSLSGAAGPAIESNWILDKTDIDVIPRGTLLILTYISVFVTAEAAFILMAIKEYIQDLMEFKERDLILNSYR